jgi:HK97 family phage portal protein
MSVVKSQRLSNLGITPYLQLFGLSVVWGTWDEVDIIQKGYMNTAALYSIINRISRTAASAPFKVYKIKNQAKHRKVKGWTGANATKESMAMAIRYKELAYEEDTNHPLNALLDRPNPWQAGSEFTQSSVAFKLLTGNRFLLKAVLDIGANQGKVASVVNLPPQYTAVRSDDTLFGVAGYILNLGVPKDIPVEEIIHSKYFNPNITATGEHLKGLSPLAAGRRNLLVTEAGEERTLAMLRNAGAAGMVFNKTVDGLSQNQAELLKNKINREVLGIENTGTVSFANGDFGYIDFGKTAEQIGVLAEKKYSKQELCNIYGVPYILFDADNSTYNNISEAKKELITMAVVPELASLRDDWNMIAKLFGADVYIDYDLSVYPELQEDLEKISKIMASSWWITPNEKRLAMGEDEDTEEPMMGRYLVPSNLVDISTLDPAVLDAQMNMIDQQTQDNLNNQNTNQ